MGTKVSVAHERGYGNRKCSVALSQISSQDNF